MKWINASERLPKTDKHIPLRIDGTSHRTGNFFINEETQPSVYVSGIESYTVSGEKLKGVEWLDESEDDIKGTLLKYRDYMMQNIKAVPQVNPYAFSFFGDTDEFIKLLNQNK